MDKQHSSRRSGGRLFESLESRQLLYAASLLADVNAQDSSNPRDFVEFGSQLFFVADHQGYGDELFVTDGTAAGTHLLKDIHAGSFGSAPSNFVVSGDYLYFAANSIGTSRQLWRTDGTTAGTIEVDEGPAGFGNSFVSISEAVDVDGTLYFVGGDAGGSGLWHTRGDQDGIDQIVEFSDTALKGAHELTALNGKLYFIGDHNTKGKELWTAGESWGSAAQVVEIVPSTSGIGAEMLVHDGSLYFFATTDALGLWKSDGTAAGTIRVEALPDAAAHSLLTSGDGLYFVSGTAQTQSKLWQSDGTELGTAVVYEPAAPTNLFNLSAAGDRVYFNHWVNNSTHLYTFQVGSGVTEVHTLAASSSYATEAAAYFDGEYYFVVAMASGRSSLWKSDGTASALVLENSGGPLGAALGKLFLAAGPTYDGQELWRIESASSTPELVIDLPASKTEDSAPRDFLMVGSQLYFTADGGTGRSLWVSDGTPGNATRLIDLVQLNQTHVVDGRLYFVGVDYDGQTFLALTDGSAAGTRRFEIPFASSALPIGNMTDYQGELLFTLDDLEGNVLLCRVLDEAVQVIESLGTGAMWGAPSGTVVDGRMYFLGPGPPFASGQAGGGLWVTDGTSAGTYSFYDQLPFPMLPVGDVVTLDDQLFFVELSGAGRLWRTDGTAEGTVLISGVSDPRDFTLSGGFLYFTKRGQTSSRRDLMRIDAQASAATLIKADVAYRSSSSSPPFMADLNGTLYYLGDTSYDTGLHKVIGPNETTRVVGLSASMLSELIVVDGVLYFHYGLFDVMRSDGTRDGTFLLPYYSWNLNRVLDLAGTDGKLFFSNGQEPYVANSRSVVTGQQLFYSGSSFDSNGAALGAGDNAAIALDKTAYLPGTGLATVENISSYAHGITGVMVDFSFLTAELSLADFQFRVGTGNDPSNWADAPQPTAFRSDTTYPGYYGLPVRVSFAWEDGAIKNTWLEVTVLANERTGLTQPKVFYFGSRIGDTGSGSPTAAITNIADELAVRNASTANAAITSLLDFDRDGLVNIADALIARNNPGVLMKLNLPAPAATAPPAAASPLVNEPLQGRSVAASADAPAARPFARGELLAYALRSWQQLLEAEDEELLVGALLGSRLARR